MKEFYICLISDAKYLIKNLMRDMLGITIKRLPKSGAKIVSKVPVRKIKKIIRDRGLAVSNGQASWFYTAYERGGQDPLTNFAMDYIIENVPHEAKILVTGCGTGIMVFHLADSGFRNIEGFDYLQECVDVANDVSKLGDYGIRFYQDDGFQPKSVAGKYNVITAMHWVFSAWMGNYGNKRLEHVDLLSDEFRESLLTDFLKLYSDFLLENGMLILELTDAVADYRIAEDHPLGEDSKNIYPIRHTPDQVKKCAEMNGLKVVCQNLSISYGHQPRTQYILQKNERELIEG